MASAGIVCQQIGSQLLDSCIQFCSSYRSAHPVKLDQLGFEYRQYRRDANRTRRHYFVVHHMSLDSVCTTPS